MTQLVSADVQKAGLWYYCLEQVWKSTGEVGEIFIERHQEGWVGACVIAVKDTPEERVWFLRVCSDLMAMSPPPPRWSSWLYPMLLREKKPDTVPLLLDAMLFNKEDIFEFIYTMSEYADSRSADALERLATKYPPPDDRTRLLVEAIKQHENDPTLTVETFNARRIAELLAPVRARRAPPPEPEPPFRLGTKIIKPAKQP